MNFLRGLITLAQLFVVGFWPIWLGMLLVFSVSHGLKISILQNLHRKQKIVLYTSIVLFVSLLFFIWANSLLANVRMLFAHISFDEVVYADEIVILRKQIHQELWLRMILPPMKKECFSPVEICDWVDGVLSIQEKGNGYPYTITERWLGYISRFLVFGFPLGLGTAWWLDFLIQRRINKS